MSLSRLRLPALSPRWAPYVFISPFLALFAVIYVSLSQHNPQAFSERLDPFAAYYFSLTVLATVGFGDITPVTVLARSVTMVQMAIDLALIGILVRIVSSAANRAKGKKQEG